MIEYDQNIYYHIFLSLCFCLKDVQFQRFKVTLTQALESIKIAKEKQIKYIENTLKMLLDLLEEVNCAIISDTSTYHTWFEASRLYENIWSLKWRKIADERGKIFLLFF